MRTSGARPYRVRDWAVVVGFSLGVAFIVLPPVTAWATTLPHYECSSYTLPGCYSPYNCTSPWTNQVCDNPETNSKSKRGFGIPFHICVLKYGASCEQTRVKCYKEEYYDGFDCTSSICTILYNWTDGCVIPT